MARDLAGYARLRLSTFPQPRPSTADTHADQRVHQNYPQACAQGVILAGQRLQATHELEETAGDTTSSRPPGPAGRHRHADRLPAKGGPGQVFTARGRDLMSDQLQEEPRHVQYDS